MYTYSTQQRVDEMNRRSSRQYVAMCVAMMMYMRNLHDLRATLSYFSNLWHFRDSPIEAFTS